MCSTSPCPNHFRFKSTFHYPFITRTPPSSGPSSFVFRDFTDELREHVYAPKPGGHSDADSSSGGQGGGTALRSIPKHRAKTV